MSKGNLRIITALLFSMAFHAMLIATEFVPVRSPVTGLARRKVSVRLVGRQALTEKVLARQVSLRPGSKVNRLPALTQAVEVAVKEIPAFTAPQMPMVPELYQEVGGSRPEEGESLTVESSESLSTAEVKARPLYLDNPPPEYPALARRRHWQGTVLLEVMVSREGKVLQVRVSESSGREVLDEAALRAVSGWRFEPGSRGSRRVDMQVLVPVRFSIE
jgi:protein TonB